MSHWRVCNVIVAGILRISPVLLAVIPGENPGRTREWMPRKLKNVAKEDGRPENYNEKNLEAIPGVIREYSFKKSFKNY